MDDAQLQSSRHHKLRLQTDMTHSTHLPRHRLDVDYASTTATCCMPTLMQLLLLTDLQRHGESDGLQRRRCEPVGQSTAVVYIHNAEMHHQKHAHIR